MPLLPQLELFFPSARDDVRPGVYKPARRRRARSLAAAASPRAVLLYSEGAGAGAGCTLLSSGEGGHRQCLRPPQRREVGVLGGGLARALNPAHSLAHSGAARKASAVRAYTLSTMEYHRLP